MRSEQRTWSLRHLINLAIFVFVLPLLLVVTITYRYFNEQIENNSSALLQKTTELLSRHQVAQYLDDIERQFNALYEQVRLNPDAFLTKDPASAGLMRQLASAYPEIKNVGVINSQGKYNFEPDWHPDNGRDLRTGPYYTEPLIHAGNLVWTVPIRSEEKRFIPMITMAKGVFDHQTGKIKTVLTINFYLEHLSERLTNSDLPSEANLLVLDREGNIIAYPDNNYLGKNIDYYFAGWREKIKGQSGELLSPNGTHRAFYHRVSHLGWYQLFVFPNQLVENRIDKALRIATPYVAIAMVLFYALFALIGNFSLNFILDQVVNLVRAVRNDTLSEKNIAIRELFEIHKELHGMNQDFRVMQKKSQTDALTGLFNRNALDEMLLRLDDQSANYQLAFIDIDNFRNLNEVYGHVIGDTVLRRIARAGLDLFADELNTLIFRSGGEEIVVISVDSDSNKFTNLISRWRKMVTMMQWREPELLVTFSASVTTFNGYERSIDVLRRAENGVAQAKEGGRNLIVEI